MNTMDKNEKELAAFHRERMDAPILIGAVGDSSQKLAYLLLAAMPFVIPIR